MAKGNRLGAVVAFADTVVHHVGEVINTDESGVTISTRAYGRQIVVDRFYPWEQVVVASDVGHGFAVVKERAPVASYHGTITPTEDGVDVQIESGRVFSFAKGAQYEVHYDDDQGRASSTEAKVGIGATRKFMTADERSSGKASAKKKAKPASGKVARTKKRGTRRAA